jgi:hypothetical protein
MQLLEFHSIFRAVLGCAGDLGYSIRSGVQQLAPKDAIESSA